MFVDECHVTSLNQGLFSTTMEAEKRDPGNEVVIHDTTQQRNKNSGTVFMGWLP